MVDRRRRKDCRNYDPNNKDGTPSSYGAGIIKRSRKSTRGIEKVKAIFGGTDILTTNVYKYSGDFDVCAHAHKYVRPNALQASYVCDVAVVGCSILCFYYLWITVGRMYCEIPKLFRCCFCLPLRRGALIFGYVNILFSAFMVGLYSYSVHKDFGFTMVYHGSATELQDSVCVGIYCVEIVMNILLVYGAHMRNLPFLKAFYYYAIATALMTFVVQIVGLINSSRFGMEIEMSALFITGLCIHIYLIIIVRSLLIKLEISESHSYENQLEQIVSGEFKVESNGVYPSTVVPNDAA